MATHMHGARTQRAAPAPVAACDGCGVPNTASWLTLFVLGAYCRDCIGPVAEAYRGVVDGAYAGEPGAKELREIQVADLLKSPRPYTRSAALVREHFGFR